MTAELRKLLALPTPRWTLVATVFGVVVAALVAALAGPGNGEDMMPVQLGVGLATIGRRDRARRLDDRRRVRPAHAAPRAQRRPQPGAPPARQARRRARRRHRRDAVVSAVTAPVFSAIASAHDESMPVADQLKYGLAALVNNLIYATVAFALALLTRSMAGGMALALVFAFVIDSLMSAIPVVGDYALSPAWWGS